MSLFALVLIMFSQLAPFGWLLGLEHLKLNFKCRGIWLWNAHLKNFFFAGGYCRLQCNLNINNTHRKVAGKVLKHRGFLWWWQFYCYFSWFKKFFFLSPNHRIVFHFVPFQAPNGSGYQRKRTTTRGRNRHRAARGTLRRVCFRCPWSYPRPGMDRRAPPSPTWTWTILPRTTRWWLRKTLASKRTPERGHNRRPRIPPIGTQAHRSTMGWGMVSAALPAVWDFCHIKTTRHSISMGWEWPDRRRHSDRRLTCYWGRSLLLLVIA